MLRAIILSLVAFLANEASAADTPRAEIVKALDLLVAKDYAAARAIVEPLASSGDRDARHMLAYLEQHGLGGPKNLLHAIELYYDAAVAGSADSQYALGDLAFSGDGVKQDYGRAAGWLQMAAGQSHAGALTRLGQMHGDGLGVPKDARLAATLFGRAADKGDPSAEYFLGNAYLAGEGVKQGFKEAAAFYTRASEKGHADAQYNLALLYDSDRLGPPNAEKTYGWMRAAADAGLPEAMVAIGLMAHNGKAKGEKAGDWFEKAAKAGDAQGQFLYAVALAQGDGRPKDPAQALMWLDRAVAAGDDLPQNMRVNAGELRASLIAASGGFRD